MASKSELLEAQNFSRRRLLTAFVSGAPGGRELEPAKPMRAVYAGIGLSAVVVAVALFFRMIAPGLPAGWENGRLIVDTESGSRYVSVEGTLHPVLNIASARLLLPEGAADKPVVAKTAQLASKRIGPTLGIPGAPDTLPVASSLINDHWTACVAGEKGAIDARVMREPIATKVDDPNAAVLVTVDNTPYVIAGDKRYELPVGVSDGLLRSIGLSNITPRVVSDKWLMLFAPGEAIGPLDVGAAGEPAGVADLLIGDVVTGAQGTEDRYVVVAGGRLAPMSPFTYALYQNTEGYSKQRERDVDPAEIASLPDAAAGQQVQSPDWPLTSFTPAASETAPCAISVTDGTQSTTHLALAHPGVTLSEQRTIEYGSGALVQVAGFAADAASILVLIDATATAFEVPDSSDTVLAQLGFSATDKGAAGATWMALFRGGKALDPQAARGTTDAPTS